MEETNLYKTLRGLVKVFFTGRYENQIYRQDNITGIYYTMLSPDAQEYWEDVLNTTVTGCVRDYVQGFITADQMNKMARENLDKKINNVAIYVPEN